MVDTPPPSFPYRGGTSKGGSLEAIVERKGPVVEEDLSVSARGIPLL